MRVNQEDTATLRKLASRYMEYAVSPENNAKRTLWKNLNLHRPDRPVVAMDQLPWNEMDVDGSLVCTVSDPYFRDVEDMLRKQIYKWEHMRADMVLNPYILLSRPIGNTGYGVTIEEETLSLDKTSDVHSHHYHNLFKEPEDIEKIKDPVITIDRKAESEILEEAHRIFDGIAPIKLGGMLVHCGLWDSVAMWMGVENCYLEILDRPEFIHALMNRYTDAAMALLDQLEAEGLYDINSNMCHCSYTFSDTLPSPECDPDRPTPKDGWAFGMAQLFTCVSPAVTAEFEIPYMQRLFSRFGSVYYGCCDRLDDRLELIDRLPNVRKVSCSPWSDREAFAEKLPDKYIMSNKPTPAYLATDSFDEDLVRKDLRRTIEAARSQGKCLEMILKDVSTIRYDPARLWRWSEIALEEASR